MIYVTGDTHGIKGIIDRLQACQDLTEDDCLIIAGDFGGIWSTSIAGIKEEIYQLDMISERLKFPLLFIDGNHENFDRLSQYPVEKWNQGLAAEIRPNIIYLQRGSNYFLQGNWIFTLGGGTSIDKNARIPGRSWWPQENIMEHTDIKAMYQNFIYHNYHYDYVITHSAPALWAKKTLAMFNSKYFEDDNSNFLTGLRKMLSYKKWYFGHYHFDYNDKNFRALYWNVVPLGE